MTEYEEERMKNIQVSDLGICIVREKMVLILQSHSLKERNHPERYSQTQG